MFEWIVVRKYNKFFIWKWNNWCFQISESCYIIRRYEVDLMWSEEDFCESSIGTISTISWLDIKKYVDVWCVVKKSFGK